MSGQPRRRAALRKQKELFLARTLAFALVAAVVGGGLAAYSTSSLLVAGRNNATVYVPDVLTSDAPGRALVLLTDGQGRPLAGESVSVEVRRGGQVVWTGEAKTDAAGLAEPSFAGVSGVGEVEVAVTGAGETVVKKARVETTTRIFLQTDKPIYQPGQTVHLRTLTFSGKTPAVSTAGVTIEIAAPSGDRIFRKALAPDAYGIAGLDYPLGDRLPLGLYEITATVGEQSVTKAFGVQRYVLPRFVITFPGLHGWYQFGEVISGVVQADYVFGEPVAGTATVTARVFSGEWTDLDMVSGPLFNARLPFMLPPAYAANPALGGYVELQATVTDTAGHSETKTLNLPLSNAPILITALADANVPGATSQYFVVARWPDGLPAVGASVTFNVGTSSGTTTTDARGVAEVSFAYTTQDSLRITVRSGNYSSTLTQALTAQSGVKVVADEAHYEVGEVAHLQVFFSGESWTDWVYYEVVARDFVIATGRVTLTGSAASFDLPVDRSLVPLAEVRVYKTLTDLTVSRDRVAFTVGTLSELSVDIAADKAEYRPGEEVRLDFTVLDGVQPIAAALGVSIVDRAVYEVDERFRGLEAAFTGSEGEVPYDVQVFDYVYGQRAVPPDAAAPLVVTPQAALADEMVSTLPIREARAAAAQDTAVGAYWSALALAAVAGYLGLVVLGFRDKRYAALALALTMILPAVAALGALYSRVGTLASPSSPEGDRTVLFGQGLGGPPVAAEEPGGIFGFAGDRTATGPSGANVGQGPTIATPPRVRTFFPETWYWNPAVITGPDGRANLTLFAPDSITTWAVDAIASTQDARLGSGNTTVRVFQDFFVEPDIPLAAVQNDTFDLRVSVFSYRNATDTVTVRLTPDAWFTLGSPGAANLTIGAGEVRSVSFTITATEIGVHNLTVLAGNLQVSDAVVRVVRVDPRGAPVERTSSGRLTGTESKTVNLVLRDDRIPGTESALVRLQPSMNAVILDGADNYIHYVSGCGEQSMSTLNIDVLAFRLVAAGTSEERMLEVEGIVNQGIQHELQFLVEAQNGQGRGIVWFPGDQDAHPWLTSWGLITFQDAIAAGFALDEDILTDMQDWLVSVQRDDGSWEFPEWGIYEFNNPILRSKEVAATAYIARALLYSGYPADASAVQKALGYVAAKARDLWDDPYTLALSLIVLHDAGGSSALRSDIATRLVELKREDNGTVFWKSPSSILSDGNSRFGGYWGEHDSRTSETTGYAVMALSRERGYTSEVAGGVEYLLARRNPFGGYFSTQDTVVALQALLDVGSGSAPDGFDVTVAVNGTPRGSVRFDASNRDLTYLLDITPYLTAVTTVEITASGNGSVVYQVVLSEYVPWSVLPAPACVLCLDVTYSDLDVLLGDTVNATVVVTYTGDAPQLKMVLVTVASGVGLTFDVDALDALVASDAIALYEFEAGSVRLYIENVAKGAPVTLVLPLTASTPFEGTLQGSQAEDLYDPGVADTVLPVICTVAP